MSAKQSYKYIIENSILYNQTDDYCLAESEYYLLYSFYVTYSMCAKQSQKKRSAIDYGWSSDSIVESGMKTELETVLKLDFNNSFVFTEEDNLKQAFTDNDLGDGGNFAIDRERAVIAKTNESNKYYKLFYRIRNGLAHGRFVLKLNSKQEKMILIQDNDKDNVTARMVLKLETLLSFVKVIDNKKLIQTY